jgi:hypothetical protein
MTSNPSSRIKWAVPVMVARLNFSIIFVFVNLETYSKKFFFLLDFTNENK